MLAIMKERHLSNSAFSALIDLPLPQTEQLLAGEIRITDDLANRLPKTLGSSPQFWLAREKQYRDDLQRYLDNSEPRQSVWLAKLPTRDMRNFGWIEATSTRRAELFDECLDFFGVGSILEWESLQSQTREVLFRTSPAFEAKIGATSAWLRQGEKQAVAYENREFDRNALIAILPELKKLTIISNPRLFFPTLQSLCRSAGVLVEIVKAPDGCRASGAIKFSEKGSALVLLSLRFRSDDHFWFTFFHELGHLILHHHMKINIDEGVANDDRQEIEADEFSINTLLPKHWIDNYAQKKWTWKLIVRTAVKAGVSPGIVVGQLQNRGAIDFNNFNYLKRKFQFDDFE
jgi:plasmid maintenance system antidote protein VapI